MAIWVRRSAIAIALLFGTDLGAQPAAWVDPSPHRTRLVRVAPGVDIEVVESAGRFLRPASADSVLPKYLGGIAQVDLRQVRAATLAIYALIPSAQAMFPYWTALDTAARARAEQSFAALTALHGRLRAEFQQAVPQARAIFIPGARHYVFLTHPGETEHAMLEFLLPPPARQ